MNGCRKGDYYRYLAEFKTDQERKEAAEESLKGYEACSFDISYISTNGWINACSCIILYFRYFT
jgi:hypothetical protein